MALTPLIDIIFLLLLFFMLSSTFTRFAEVPLMNAGAGSSADTPQIFLQLGDDGLRLNGGKIRPDVLKDAILDRIGEEAATAMITLSGQVSSQHLVDLLSELRGLPNITVSVLE